MFIKIYYKYVNDNITCVNVVEVSKASLKQQNIYQALHGIINSIFLLFRYYAEFYQNLHKYAANLFSHHNADICIKSKHFFSKKKILTRTYKR